MGDISNYQLRDFLADEEFRNWVLQPDIHSNEFWIGWMNAHQEQKETILKAKEIIISLRYEESAPVGSGEKHEILKKILKEGAEDSTVRKISTIRASMAVAASLLLALVIGYTLYNDSNDDLLSTSEKTQQKIVRSNPRGVKSEIRLKDGTKVHLNANSSITYLDNYDKKRYIELSGEAFFDVATDPDNPLIVKSGSISTKAIGTAFNIVCQTDKSEVLLIEGVVEVQDNGTQSFKKLLPMQKLSYSKEQGFSNVMEVDNQSDILWTRGILHFDGVPVDQVFERLEDWFDVDIQVSGEAQSLRYSGEFDNEYLDNIIKAMSIALDFEYQLDNKKLIVDFN